MARCERLGTPRLCADMRTRVAPRASKLQTGARVHSAQRARRHRERGIRQRTARGTDARRQEGTIMIRTSLQPGMRHVVAAGLLVTLCVAARSAMALGVEGVGGK